MAEVEETENFYVPTRAVLEAALRQNPAAVLVAALDDHGNISVYGSHSTPVTMLLAKQVIPTIDALGVPNGDAA